MTVPSSKNFDVEEGEEDVYVDAESKDFREEAQQDDAVEEQNQQNRGQRAHCRNNNNNNLLRDVKLFDTVGKRRAWAAAAGVLVITGIAILAASLRKVSSTEYGIKYNVHKKQLDDAAKMGGLYAGTPGFEFIKFPSTFITVDLPRDTCVSKDGLRVNFLVTFQYQIPEQWVLPVVIKYRNFDKWATVVEAAGSSAVQHSCSEFFISDFQNQRGVIQSTMESNLRWKLEGSGGDGKTGVYARAISLQLRNVQLPEEYQVSVREKQAAAEDIALAKNQRVQEITKARTLLLAAKEQSQRILDTAANDANVTMVEADLKAQETTFAFDTEAEVLVRARESLNLTTDGLLAYMANQMFKSVPNLKVSTGEPARLSRKGQL